jgi:hypothetical protein
MTQFEQFVNQLADYNSSDVAFSMLVDECERNIGCNGRREDSFVTRVLRIHNMIDSLHMNGCLTFSSYIPQ